MDSNSFNQKFKINQLMIYETNYWIWSLRPHQATIGAGILSLKRFCSSFSELTKEEYNDLGKIIKVIEPTLTNVFKCDVINYLMLMMVDKHVHYHIIPRYKKPIEILEKKWVDQSWPAIPNLKGDAQSHDSMMEILSLIKKSIDF